MEATARNLPVAGTVESAETTDLYKALFKVQGEMESIQADCINTTTNSRYGSLQAAMKYLRPKLKEANLLVMQSVLQTDDFSRIGITQKVVHVESGQFITDTYWLPVPNNHPQSHAIVMTYLGRYLLKTRFLLTFKEDDEDGNVMGVAASGLSVSAPHAQNGDQEDNRDSGQQPASAQAELVTWTHPESGQDFPVSKLCLRQLERMPSMPLANLQVAEADASQRFADHDLAAFTAAIEYRRQQLDDAFDEGSGTPATCPVSSPVPVVKPDFL